MSVKIPANWKQEMGTKHGAEFNAKIYNIIYKYNLH